MRTDFYAGRKEADYLNDRERQEGKEYCEAYIRFLNAAKTERETIDEAVRIAEHAGFAPLGGRDRVRAGDKIYAINAHKSLILAVIGDKPLDGGCSLIVAHTDSPRLDLKPAPILGKNGLGYLDAHYYGSIKKYQWPTVPLALHGIAVKKDGSKRRVVIGESETDPIFGVTDLSTHLAGRQMNESARDIIPGDALDLLACSDRRNGDAKACMLDILSGQYGIEEEDLISAEFEAVPAYRAREMGFDRGMIAAYGQDDRACVFAALRAISSLSQTGRTAICLFADKEEIGSLGNTSTQSLFFPHFLEELCEWEGCKPRHVFPSSMCLSADVIAAFDPTYPEVFGSNAAHLHHGVAIAKYRGSRGKQETNDASAETVAFLRNVLDQNEILWQTGETGKVDEGRSQTVAHIITGYNMPAVDLAVPILSMHSPLEVTDKLDLFMAYKAYRAFLQGDAQ
ncbi:MAG: aminopeptidase [Clostridiales Family XIII bacterium]|jgi:aspartyl aminopeptidase|nr:aminopeptidase [Clostridiales Family XIII bacterium]